MKIAIVYDWIDKWGGVERLLLNLHEMYPEADWYTSYYDKKEAPWAKKLNIHTSFIQNMPPFIRKSRMFSSLLYPFAFESFNFSSYDVVISVTSSFAKGVITKPHTKHICYLLTPTRYLWGMTDEYLKGLTRILAGPILKKLRQWDLVAAQRPDVILTLSEIVAERCKTYYGREAQVVYPPFDIEYWKQKKKHMKKIEGDVPDEFYLVVSRLEPYKTVSLVTDTWAELKGKDVIIVGKGSLKNELVDHATENVHFIENVTDEELAWLYAHAKALIMPQEEDFGYVSLEAQSCGSPVIAYKKGGAMETVKEGKSGVFFESQNVSSLRAVVERFDEVAYNIRKNLENEGEKYLKKFEKKKFQTGLLDLIY